MNKNHFILLLFLFLGLHLKAQVVSEPFWRPDRGILSTESDTINNLLYVGGNFTKFIPPSEPNGSKVNFSGEPDYSVANPNSYVFCSVSDGNGGFYIGGNFTQVGDSMRRAVAHIDASGNVSSWNPDIVGSSTTTVRAIALSGDSLFIGGYFSQIGGETRYNFAAVSTVNASLYNWSPAFNGTIYSLVSKNNALYVAGTFTHTSGSVVFNNIVRFNMSSGTPSNWKPDITGFINEMEVIDSTVYISGPIFTVNGENRPGFAAIYEIRDSFGTITGDSLSDLVISTDGNFFDLLIKGDSLFLSGQFTTLNSQTRDNIALVNRHDGQVLPLSIDVDGDVSTMNLKDSILYFGGNFMAVNGLRRESLGAYNLNSLSVTNWNPGVVSGTISNIEIAAADIYVSGSFYSIGTNYRKHAAALNPSTGVPTSWAPEFDEKVNVIHVKGDKIFVGGDFTEVNGNTRNHLAIFDRTTGNLLPWNPSVNGSVFDIASNDSIIFVGGDFSQVDGISYGNLAAFNPSSETLLSFNAGLNDLAKCLHVTGNYLYVGGVFTNSNTSNRDRIARFDLSSLALDSWNPSVNGEVRSIAENGNQILIGGLFTTVNSTSRNRFASIQNSASNLNSLDINPDGSINAILSYGTKAYLGGEFTTIDGQQRLFNAELDLATGNITPWNISPAGPYGGTASLSIYDSILIIGGSLDEQASGHVFGIPDFSNFTPSPFSVNVFTHPSFYNTCSGSAIIQITGAPGFTTSVDNNPPIYSNGTITVDSLCAGIHNLTVYDFYNDSITQYFVVGQDSGIFVLDTISLSGVTNLFGLTIENCNIDYASIDTVFIVSCTVSENQLMVVWSVIDSAGLHTDSTYYDLYFGSGFYYIQVGFYCPFKSTDKFYSYTQYVNVSEGNGNVASIPDPQEKTNRFAIYPNPTNNQVRINFSGSDAELTVYDLQGKVVLKDRIQNQGTVSLENFERGVYLFDFRNSQGQSVQRVVKQ